MQSNHREKNFLSPLALQNLTTCKKKIQVLKLKDRVVWLKFSTNFGTISEEKNFYKIFFSNFTFRWYLNDIIKYNKNFKILGVKIFDI